MARVLIVDDEQAILDLLALVLEREGFTELATASSGAEALRLAEEFRPDLVILDVMLPDTDGFRVATSLRPWFSGPILFLTARSADIDKLMGFGVGGDDYVTKPFNPLEVVARVKAHMRRTGGPVAVESPERAVHDFGRWRLSEEGGVLEVGGAEVQMPAREFQLLAFLARNAGRVFSARQLYRQVWGEEALGEADDNTVMVHVRRIREKIECDPGSPCFLLTMRGLGYKLVRPKAESA